MKEELIRSIVRPFIAVFLIVIWSAMQAGEPL